MNNSLLERIHLYFITAFYAIYNSQTRILRYAAGAHPPPFLLRKGIISEISGSGGLIGVFPDAQYSENEITLEPGDRIIIYTDGLIEAVDDKKIPFGNKLSEVLQKCGSSVNDSIEYLYAELIKHRGAEKFDDDVCILGMKISEETPGG
ncbi:MAG TPA: hypothetical protein DC049_04425 [Spirochaetia bacterium]|nr:hypothetical protein [Spirochaetia bacterium]